MGLLADIPEQLHAEIFPFPKDGKLDIDKLLNQLQKSGFIIRFEADPLTGQDPDERCFVKILNFHKHQNPHKKECETKSIFPDYDPKMHKPGLDPVNNGTSRADSLNLIPDSLIPQPSYPTPEQVRSVFDHYVKTFNKNTAFKFTEERVRLIKQALKRGHEINDLLKAITAMSTDEWPGRKKNNDLVYAIGNQNGIDKVEKWLTNPQNTPTTTKESAIDKYFREQEENEEN